MPDEHVADGGRRFDRQHDANAREFLRKCIEHGRQQVGCRHIACPNMQTAPIQAVIFPYDAAGFLGKGIDFDGIVQQGLSCLGQKGFAIARFKKSHAHFFLQ
ncbi:hypothetical protein D1872_295210 [compost metagenome]